MSLISASCKFEGLVSREDSWRKSGLFVEEVLLITCERGVVGQRARFRELSLLTKTSDGRVALSQAETHGRASRVMMARHSEKPGVSSLLWMENFEVYSFPWPVIVFPPQFCQIPGHTCRVGEHGSLPLLARRAPVRRVRVCATQGGSCGPAWIFAILPHTVPGSTAPLACANTPPHSLLIIVTTVRHASDNPPSLFT